MPQITITEALSEVNLIKKKVMAKEEKIKNALVFAQHLPDPFVNEGGAPQMVKNEIQSMNDLKLRLMKIRAGISAANLTHGITLNGVTRSIHDWLVWKREVVQGEQAFYKNVVQTVKAHNDGQTNRPQFFKDKDESVQLVKYTVTVDYAGFISHQTFLMETLEMLDGQLSLKNATITIEI